MSWSITKSRIEGSVWNAKNKVKEKVNNTIDYTKKQSW